MYGFGEESEVREFRVWPKLGPSLAELFPNLARCCSGLAYEEGVRSSIFAEVGMFEALI